MELNYHDALAMYGIGGAHPGGLKMTKEILENEAFKRETRVLDAGCGTGQTASYIAKNYNCHVIALDLHPIMIKKAKERFKREKLSIHLVQGSVEKIPFPDQTFDKVIAESVTAFTNIPISLKEYFRVLKQKGVLITIDMTKEQNLSVDEQKRVQEVYGIQKVLSEEEWTQSFQSAQFSSTDTLFSSSVSAQMEKVSLNHEELPEYQPSTYIHPKADEILNQHQTLNHLLGEKLGYRIYRSMKNV
ncbi:ubiquinone/menaquinone biosynthesis C-methylase UbiE [Oikeobacillus pervagus]|uniref:Ubiquinone/menaquinone biosynthesis C-methylase UbiE n=1 Tax=Oikeobacillus pervagus TaxID=1325931 RepID=A0AAJ1SYW2_9BACI|nr:class I SAM-dependent methyltransferase [Oikeobacillus pervagus]MDQ0215333.1 ubiquinone/menaquinone biosynthesis C-methylase UbiE [Oikeobacillus pervagus]